MPVNVTRKDITRMLRRYAAGRAGEQERAFLESLYRSLDKTGVEDNLSPAERQQLEQQIEAYLQAHIHGSHRQARRGWVRYAAAACVLLALATGSWYLFHWQKAGRQPAITGMQQDVAPGTTGAILTLADGSRIVLDSAANGTIAAEGATAISKQNGTVTYHAGQSAGTAISYNTMSTPRGRQYGLTLSDGTKVWLNAASSLRYPAAFSGSERVVTLTGEGYFEVARNAAMPFHVKVRGADIAVTGTHFNIMGYEEEAAIKTTLLEGRVNVTAAGNTRPLLPGQQATIDDDGHIAVAKADTDMAMAWKEGFFQFDETGLPTILRQLSRWYNIEVSYEGAVGSRKFFGRISRNMNLSDVLALLKQNHVHFRIEGRTLIVTP